MAVDIMQWPGVMWQELRSLELSVWIAILVASLVLLGCFPYLKNLGKNLPPGPPSWPVLGSLMYLGGELHQVLWELAKKHGPVMKVGLGQYTLIVISSAEAAEELMKKKDSEFSHRAARTIQRSAAKYIGIESHDIAFAEYNPQLRLLRKFVATELFTNNRMIASSKIRTKEVGTLVTSVKKASDQGKPVDLREYLHTMTMNSICMMLFGKRYYGLDTPQTEEGETFARVIRDVFDNVGKLNFADLIPAMRWFDLQGIEAQWKRIRPQADRMVGKIIEEHRQKKAYTGRTDHTDTRDFVDVLLTPMGNETLSDKAIMGTIFDMIMGGTDTTATTIEWCVLEVVRYPEIQRKLREEIERVVGTERRVEESDIPNLPYLQAFVKEIFRLHTSVPLTLPRLNDNASTLGGFDIPPLSTIFVNIYAIAHDPKYWENPEEFNPDRFLTNNISVLGTDYELLPFGSGRRKCVGIQLGMASVTRTTAALVQAFDWAPPPGVKPEDLDLSETYAIVLRKRIPLVAVATPRPEARFYEPESL
ncbi:unnamed protein product [Calypogeia fissa]